MTPEVRTLVYSTISAVILAILAALGWWLRNIITRRQARPTPVDQGQAITNLADTMVKVSTAAVVGVRAELEAARQDLQAARGELAAAVQQVKRLTRRVALLERLLEVHRIEIPPEDSD